MLKIISRREFLLATAAIAALAICRGIDIGLGRSEPTLLHDPSPPPQQRKVIVILFGGGTRSSESIADLSHAYIPHLWKEMVPQGTLFTNMRVEHRVVHPNSAGSIVTGHWEWDDLDWTCPVAHATIFEIYRKARGMPDTSTWAFVYASILSKTAESLAEGYGTPYAANVVEPPTIPRSTTEVMDRLMANAASVGSLQAEMEAAYECGRLARGASRISLAGLRSENTRAFIEDEYAMWKTGSGTTSHDAFLTDRVIACMKRFAPSVLYVCFGEIDCAHYGSWSRYVEAIRRTDELTWRIWRATEELKEYQGRTLILILPDHGRELDRPDRSGFIHHSDFYTDQDADEGCRRVWMLALGPGVKAQQQIANPVPITAVAATTLEYLGLTPSANAEKSVWGIITRRQMEEARVRD